jgi:spermidine/putrescine transport system substrate-binding protein
MTLVAMGKNPPTSTPADWRAAAKKLEEQKPLVRGYWDASYIDQLKNGNTWISMAWSGDIFQANLNGYTHLKPVMPKGADCSGRTTCASPTPPTARSTP